ncbi:MAG: sigma-54-dependent transcriptional regulator [Planctomycetota bacterium]|jgi:two-component system nitrogen regulation response regulator NtrX
MSQSSQPSPTVLVVDDEADVRVAVEMILQYEGYRVWTAKGGQDALDRLASEAAEGQRADLVLTDVKMPGMDGLELLEALKELPTPPPVVMISGHADVPLAVDAVRRGATDFLEKPLEQNRLLVSLTNALRSGALVRENRKLKRELSGRWEAVGQSPAWREVAGQLERAAHADVPVLLLGENGTGKEVAARNLHLLGARAEGPFVAVNCAAIPDELIESELFGHEKGSFTGAHERRIGHFESADGGTLFLDEVGDMPLAAQATLLRALETREITRVGSTKTQPVDIRVVAATNADLNQAVEDKTFRMDLFYRLNVLPIRIPALRERKEDIPLLAEHFLEAIARRQGRRACVLDASAAEFLSELEFPGNVRQLRNLLEAAVVFADDDVIDAEVVQRLAGEGPGLSAPKPALAGDADVFTIETFEEFKNASEAEFIRRKLKENEGNIKRTAELLGMQRSHLYKKLDRYGLR